MRRRQWLYDSCDPAHDDDFFVARPVTTYDGAASRGRESTMSNSMVKLISIMVRRFGAPSSKPC